MNELKVFNNPEFGSIRIVEINNTLYFVASDVCKALELSNPTVAIQRLDEDERTKLNLGHPMYETNCVNEYGLYNLVLASRKKGAKDFKRWITHDVLPSIRKHGVYMANDTLEKALSSPDFLIQLATKLKEEQEQNRQLTIENERMKPKEIFADAVATSHTSILIGDLAKLIKQNGVDIGQKRLFTWLRDNGYLIKRNGTDYNMPTQRSMELGLFEVKESTVNNPDGSVRINRTTKVTGKGQQYFINKFLTT